LYTSRTISIWATKSPLAPGAITHPLLRQGLSSFLEPGVLFHAIIHA
jgi:hypothetical protein